MSATTPAGLGNGEGRTPPPAGIVPCHRPRIMLVTGGMGFIGCNLIRHLLSSDPGLIVANLDALTYAGSTDNLADLPASSSQRHHFIQGDITDTACVAMAFEQHRIDTVVHLAAESHVDRSIDDPLAFVRTNVLGTAILLHQARKAWSGRQDVRFHHISTDEVFGSLGPEQEASETTPYDPSSPYSASKAGSDHLVLAWHRTYGLPVTISNCSNNFGPYQYPEKLIPLMIAKAIAGEDLPVYGDGQQVRDWLHVDDHVRAIDAVVRRARPGTTWNIGSRNQQTNLEIVHLICDLLEELRPCSAAGGYRRLIRRVTDRPGHDRRYAIDPSRIETELGWRPREAIAASLRSTIAWYLGRQDWIEKVSATRSATIRRGAG